MKVALLIAFAFSLTCGSAASFGQRDDVIVNRVEINVRGGEGLINGVPVRENKITDSLINVTEGEIIKDGDKRLDTKRTSKG